MFYRKAEGTTFNIEYDGNYEVQMNYIRWKKYFVGDTIYGKKMPDHDKRFRLYLDKFEKAHGRSPEGDDVVLKVLGSRLGDVQYIKVVDPKSKESTHYPTQKPLALLERIIRASSNEGDVVLDPFCGCATACVAAEMHGREWVGIDLSEKAVELVTGRMKSELGLFYDANHRNDVPQRSDTFDFKHNYGEMKHILFGQQEGHCKICGHDFPFRMFEIDHVIPKSKGGPDHIENRQLLCPPCNKLKSDGTMEAAIAKYQETYANSPFMKESHA